MIATYFVVDRDQAQRFFNSAITIALIAIDKSDAEAEFQKEIVYYSNAREGLGIKFREAVMVAGAKAVTNPGAGTPSARNTRSRRLKGFPFSVVYRASDKEFLVVSVAHHRRQPEYWRGRVK